MGLVADILTSLLAPGRVVERRLRAGAGEAQALACLLGGSAFLTLGRLANLPAPGGDLPPEGMAAGVLIGGLFLAPLVFYPAAALVTAGLRLFSRGGGARLQAGAPSGGPDTVQGSRPQTRPGWLGGRFACFWALLIGGLLSLIPAGLRAGGLAGAGVADLAVFVLFAWLWAGGLAGAMRAEASPATGDARAEAQHSEGVA